MKINPLEAHFTHNQFALRLLQRDGDVALLEKSKATHCHPSFEVVIIQRHPAERVCGRVYPARESMPPSEAWGTLGWTYSSLESAKAKFQALAKSRQEAVFRPAGMRDGAFSSAGGIRRAVAKP